MDNKKAGERELPRQFQEPVRPDIIKRAVLVSYANARQPYGASPTAGIRHSAFVSKRRRKYKTTYGIGQSRTPRKVMSVRGTRFNWVGAFAPQTVGGRRAHPAKATKVWKVPLNKKERRKAIRSALAATMDKALVSMKHQMPQHYPFLVESKIEAIGKTKEAFTTLQALGFKEELARCEHITVRPGRGKMRGRRYKRKVGPLFVVSGKCKFEQSARNIPGCQVVLVKNMNAALLAPGAVPGRMTIFTDKAIDIIEKEHLFV